MRRRFLRRTPASSLLFALFGAAVAPASPPPEPAPARCRDALVEALRQLEAGGLRLRLERPPGDGGDASSSPSRPRSSRSRHARRRSSRRTGWRSRRQRRDSRCGPRRGLATSTLGGIVRARRRARSARRRRGPDRRRRPRRAHRRRGTFRALRPRRRRATGRGAAARLRHRRAGRGRLCGRRDRRGRAPAACRPRSPARRSSSSRQPGLAPRRGAGCAALAVARARSRRSPTSRGDVFRALDLLPGIAGNDITRRVPRPRRAPRRDRSSCSTARRSTTPTT